MFFDLYPCLRISKVSRYLRFYEVRCQPHAQLPSWKATYLSVQYLTKKKKNLSSMGIPTSSYAAACLGFDCTGECKIFHLAEHAFDNVVCPAALGIKPWHVLSQEGEI